MQGGSPCKDPIAQFCNAGVTQAPKRGWVAPKGEETSAGRLVRMKHHAILRRCPDERRGIVPGEWRGVEVPAFAGMTRKEDMRPWFPAPR